MYRETELSSLKKFNLLMGFLHFIQGAAMLSLALLVDKFSSFKLPVWSNFLTFDTTIMQLVTNSKKIADLPFAALVACFLLLSALAHFIIVSPWGNKEYNKGLEKGINRFRWFEYALSSSLMILLIAQLFGIYDVGSLLLIFIVNASMNFFGLLMEELNQFKKKTDWSPFVFGSIAGIGPWVVVFLSRFRQLGLIKGPVVRIRNSGIIFRLLQSVPDQHGPAVQEDWKMGRLSLRGARLYSLEPGRQICPCMACVRRSYATEISFRRVFYLAMPISKQDVRVSKWIWLQLRLMEIC